jgi:hypothetical protein
MGATRPYGICDEQPGMRPKTSHLRKDRFPIFAMRPGRGCGRRPQHHVNLLCHSGSILEKSASSKLKNVGILLKSEKPRKAVVRT